MRISIIRVSLFRLWLSEMYKQLETAAGLHVEHRAVLSFVRECIAELRSMNQLRSPATIS